MLNRAPKTRGGLELLGKRRRDGGRTCSANAAPRPTAVRKTRHHYADGPHERPFQNLDSTRPLEPRQSYRHRAPDRSGAVADVYADDLERCVRDSSEEPGGKVERAGLVFRL